MSEHKKTVYKKKDFVSDQEIRWCPGCGDYAILASLQMALAKSGVPKEDVVCVSGIGCSSRLPYYLDTYGLHTIHGRAPAIATGVKLARPELNIWIVTGDGDGLSIGGNHLIHLARRNVDVNVLLFNNEIYGLTKGQFSPTSPQGAVTKTTPFGSISRSFNPAKLLLGSDATFVAKTIDTNPKQMADIMIEAQSHTGTSFVEIYQNCVIFNDKAHDLYTNRQTREDHSIYVEHARPMIFGKKKDKAIKADGLNLKIVNIEDVKEEEILVHDKTNPVLASLLIEKSHPPDFPMVLGVIYQKEEKTYNQSMYDEIERNTAKQGPQKVADLLMSGQTWTV